MSILVTCESCQSALRTKDEYAGRRIRCPKCVATITIPGERAESTIAKADAGTDKPRRATAVKLKTDESAAVPSERRSTPQTRTGLPADPVERYRQLESDVLRGVDGSI